MPKPLVGVVLGSRSDFNVMRRGLETLRVMGVPYIFEIAPPHRSPERLVRFITSASESGVEVFIAAAGGNGQLPGIIAGYTSLPIIGVPIDATPMRGEDALLGMVQMPPGTPVAVVGINSAENAAVLAAQILALKHVRLREVLAHRRMGAVQKIERALIELRGEYPDLCDPEQTSPRRPLPDSDTETDSGAEEVTPTPTPEQTERIRPGAVLISPLAVSSSDAGHLLPTPVPQEPGTVTEDASWREPTPSSPTAPPPRPPIFTFNDAPTQVTKGAARPATSFSDAPTQVAKATAAVPLPPAVQAAITNADTQPGRPKTPSGPLGFMERALADDAAHTSSRAPATVPVIETRVFKVDPTHPDVNVLEHAMLVLLEGGLIAMPTDTVYGLAADGTNEAAVTRLFELKGYDPSRKSLAMLIGDTSQLDSLVTEVPGPLERVLDEFWPGGLTVLFNRRPTVLPTVTDATSIGLRVPADPVALQLLMMMTRPLVVINTASSGGPSATAAEVVLDRFGGQIECVLDAGPCKAGETSTVLSALITPFEILREGTVAREALKNILGDRLKG